MMDLQIIKVLKRVVYGENKKYLKRILDTIRNDAQSKINKQDEALINENSLIDTHQIQINELEIKNIYVSLNMFLK